MAKLKTGLFTAVSGKTKTAQFARVNGETILKDRTETKDTYEMSLAQARQSMRWANLVNMWKAFAGKLKPSYETLDGSSLYNTFMALNTAKQPIYLTKNEKKANACVVCDYIISRGSLPAIGVSKNANDIVVTDIEVESAIDENTTLKAFSQDVIALNPDFQDGDRIVAFYVSNTLVNNLPTVKVKASYVELNTKAADDVLLYDTADENAFANNGGFLAVKANPTGAVAWVHTRKEDGKTLVSSQELFCLNSALQAEYGDDESCAKAAATYGKLKADDYMTPGAEGASEQGSYTLTIAANEHASFTVDGVAYTGPVTVEAGDSVTVECIPASGYTFEEWDDESTDNPRTILSMSGDVTLEATLSAGEMVTVTLNTAEGISGYTVNGNAYTAPVQVAKGSEVTIRANVSGGYTFVKWSDNNTSNPRTVSNIQSNLTVSAVADPAE